MCSHTHIHKRTRTDWCPCMCHQSGIYVWFIEDVDTISSPTTQQLFLYYFVLTCKVCEYIVCWYGMCHPVLYALVKAGLLTWVVIVTSVSIFILAIVLLCLFLGKLYLPNCKRPSQHNFCTIFTWGRVVDILGSTLRYSWHWAWEVLLYMCTSPNQLPAVILNVTFVLHLSLIVYSLW